MRTAVVQLNSGPDRDRNLERAENHARAAAAAGAELILLPEKWPLLAGARELAEGAESIDGPAIGAARDWARELGITLLAGSFTERAADGGLPHNTSVLISPGGEIGSVYRKLHMFDVDLPGVTYRESEGERPGDEVVVGEVAGWRVGMTICYDVRFPELHRILALRGAEAIAVPSAFTTFTGRDHWHVLLRARAIENATYVIAANQVGRAGERFDSFGHSLIADPWGEVVAEIGEGEGFAIADLEPGRVAEVRARIPALANRRPDAYRWPRLDQAG